MRLKPAMDWLNVPHLWTLPPLQWPSNNDWQRFHAGHQPGEGIDGYGRNDSEKGSLGREWKTPRERSTEGISTRPCTNVMIRLDMLKKAKESTMTLRWILSSYNLYLYNLAATVVAICMSSRMYLFWVGCHGRQRSDSSCYKFTDFCKKLELCRDQPVFSFTMKRWCRLLDQYYTGVPCGNHFFAFTVWFLSRQQRYGPHRLGYGLGKLFEPSEEAHKFSFPFVGYRSAYTSWQSVNWWSCEWRRSLEPDYVQ